MKVIFSDHKKITQEKKEKKEGEVVYRLMIQMMTTTPTMIMIAKIARNRIIVLDRPEPFDPPSDEMVMVPVSLAVSLAWSVMVKVYVYSPAFV